jgi:lysophospholipase L1-like esterase
MRAAAVLLVALALPAAGQITSGVVPISTVPALSSFPAPTGCVATSVAVFLGSPVAMGCDAGLTYDAATDTLTAGGFVGPLANVAYVGQQYLHQWDYKRAQLFAKVASTQATVALIGDSWTMSDYIGNPLRQWLQFTGGNAGPGYIGIGYNNGAPTGQGVTYARTGTWTDTVHTDAYAGIDASAATSTDTATPAQVSITATANKFVIHYRQQANGGTFRWNIDGGAWTDVDTSNATTAYATTETGTLSTASHILLIQVTVPGTAGVTMFGVDAQLTANGVRAHRLGGTGSQASQYAAMDATFWQAGLAALAPDVVVIMLGVNEHGANATPAAYSTALGTMVTRVRAALPLADVLLMSPADVGTTTTYTMAEYRDAMRTLAYSLDVAYLDGYALLGPYATANTRGLYESTTHINAVGGRVFAAAIFERMVRVRGPAAWVTGTLGVGTTTLNTAVGVDVVGTIRSNGFITGTGLIDYANGAYYLKPSNATMSQVVAGPVTFAGATLGSKSKAIVDGTPTAFATFTIADAASYSGKIIYNVKAVKGTALQDLFGEVGFSATREGTTYTAVVGTTAEAASQVLAAAAGTLTGGITIACTAGVCTLSATYDTSQSSPDSFTLKYRFNSPDAGLVLSWL